MHARDMPYRQAGHVFKGGVLAASHVERARGAGRHHDLQGQQHLLLHGGPLGRLLPAATFAAAHVCLNQGRWNVCLWQGGACPGIACTGWRRDMRIRAALQQRCRCGGRDARCRATIGAPPVTAAVAVPRIVAAPQVQASMHVLAVPPKPTDAGGAA